MEQSNVYRDNANLIYMSLNPQLFPLILSYHSSKDCSASDCVARSVNDPRCLTGCPTRTSYPLAVLVENRFPAYSGIVAAPDHTDPALLNMDLAGPSTDRVGLRSRCARKHAQVVEVVSVVLFAWLLRLASR
jgi:hypothetical protein